MVIVILLCYGIEVNGNLEFGVIGTLQVTR